MGRRFKKNKLVTAFVKVTGLPCLLILKPKFYYKTDKSPRRLPKPSILVSNHWSLIDMPLYGYHYLFHDVYMSIVTSMISHLSVMHLTAWIGANP